MLKGVNRPQLDGKLPPIAQRELLFDIAAVIGAFETALRRVLPCIERNGRCRAWHDGLSGAAVKTDLHRRGPRILDDHAVGSDGGSRERCRHGQSRNDNPKPSHDRTSAKQLMRVTMEVF